MTIERRANPCSLPGNPNDVWWCTDCNRVIEFVGERPKPSVCPLWACVERRAREASVTTEHTMGDWDELLTFAKNAAEYWNRLCGMGILADSAEEAERIRQLSGSRMHDTGELLDAARAAIASAASLKRQRDELLAACKQARDTLLTETQVPVEYLDAAIAHAEPESGKKEGAR